MPFSFGYTLRQRQAGNRIVRRSCHDVDDILWCEDGRVNERKTKSVEDDPAYEVDPGVR